MKKSKFQVPSSKEVPSFKPHKALLRLSYVLGGGDRLVLRDEDHSNFEPKRPFDLEERTAQFGEAVVKFTKKLPFNPRNDRIISQLVGAATSIGANYSEASECVSKKDFRFSISRCKKEAKETKHFLRMAVASEPQLAEEARALYREAHELLRICNAMYLK